MSKSYPVFPDIVIEGDLQLDANIASRLSAAVKQEQAKKNIINTPAGWETSKFVPLKNDLQKLQSLIIRTFFADIQKEYTAAKKMKIELVRPNLLSIKPGQNAYRKFERRRWYTGIVWIQTTNAGSHLTLHAPQSKIYSTPDGVLYAEKYQTHITPAQFKYVFWPSHLEYSFTTNHSMVDTVMLEFTITGAIPGLPESKI